MGLNSVLMRICLLFDAKAVLLRWYIKIKKWYIKSISKLKKLKRGAVYQISVGGISKNNIIFAS